MIYLLYMLIKRNEFYVFKILKMNKSTLVLVLVLVVFFLFYIYRQNVLTY